MVPWLKNPRKGIKGGYFGNASYLNDLQGYNPTHAFFFAEAGPVENIQGDAT